MMGISVRAPRSFSRNLVVASVSLFALIVSLLPSKAAFADVPLTAIPVPQVQCSWSTKNLYLPGEMLAIYSCSVTNALGDAGRRPVNFYNLRLTIDTGVLPQYSDNLWGTSQKLFQAEKPLFLGNQTDYSGALQSKFTFSGDGKSVDLAQLHFKNTDIAHDTVSVPASAFGVSFDAVDWDYSKDLDVTGSKIVVTTTPPVPPATVPTVTTSTESTTLTIPKKTNGPSDSADVMLKLTYSQATTSLRHFSGTDGFNFNYERGFSWVQSFSPALAKGTIPTLPGGTGPYCAISVSGVMDSTLGPSTYSHTCDSAPCTAVTPTDVYKADFAVRAYLEGVPRGGGQQLPITIPSNVTWSLSDTGFAADAASRFQIVDDSNNLVPVDPLKPYKNSNATFSPKREEATDANPETVFIQAKVTSQWGQPFKCAVTLRPKTEVATVIQVKKGGDCPLFTAMRNYYLSDLFTAGNSPINGSSQLQSSTRPCLQTNRWGTCVRYGVTNNSYITPTPYTLTMNYGATQVDYKIASDGANLPIKGLINAFVDNSGTLQFDTNGRPVPPSAPVYDSAVMIAREFSVQGLGKPILYGKIDPASATMALQVVPDSDSKAAYAAIQSRSDADKKKTMIVFQSFLIKTDPTSVRSETGAKDGTLKIWQFTPYVKNGSAAPVPYDRIIPFLNESCLPAFAVQMPVRKNADGTKKPFGDAMKDASLCSFSKVYSFAELMSNSADVSALYLVPQTLNATYPLELLKAPKPPASCFVPNSGASVQRQCWKINRGDMPQRTREIVTTSGGCLVNATATYYDRYGHPYDVSVKVPGPTCALQEGGECGESLALRFTGYTMMMGSALGCVAKYSYTGQDTSSVTSSFPTYDQKYSGLHVTGTLRGQGILPYTSFGGSAPKVYKSYPAALADIDTVMGGAKGYGCIPCRFGSSTDDLMDDTSTKDLPVDQDANKSRKPVFSFELSSADSRCVKDTNFEIRYFGAAACGTTGAKASDMCAANNVAPQACPASTTDTTRQGIVKASVDGVAVQKDLMFSGGTGAGNQNIAGKFSVPLCPESPMEYDSVSMSWSPILLDIGGGGIKISRDYEKAVRFDISGTGKLSRVDWPTNTDQVAFLALPDKKGRILSIKELFGTYKAKNGFAALRKFDKDGNGIIDARDPVFSQLRLWFDKNRNGKVDSGELMTLEEANVESIVLNFSERVVTVGAEGQTLSSVYFNSKTKKLMKAEDHYFYEYLKNGKRAERK